MDFKEIQLAIKQIAAEKGLSEESIMDTLNTALAAAYRKDFGNKNQNITFKLDPQTGEMEVFDTKTVVDFPPEIIEAIKENGLDKKYVHGKTEEDQENKQEAKKPKSEEQEEREFSELDEDVIRYNPKTDILLEEAQKIDKSYKVGDVIVTPLEIPSEFGRMAAQTAKQVIIQKLREAERELVYEQFKDKAGELLNAFVQRKEGRNVLIDLGKGTGIMPPEHQVKTERYNVGDRIKVYVVSVEKGVRGPEIIVSRSHPQIIAKLFETEIPEINEGLIEIVSIAREAGFRSKVAVKSNDDSIDPIGSCVGQRGARIQTIISELNGEKIDIIEYSDNPVKYISNALSPAKVVNVEINKEPEGDEPGEATVTVPEDQLSLAIGKEGQNVRLAAKLTGWKINILKEGDSEAISFDKTLEDEVADELEEQVVPTVEEDNEDIEIKDEEDVVEEKEAVPDDEQKPEEEVEIEEEPEKN